MYNYPISLTFGLIAMFFVATSYFFKRKETYLLFQLIAIFCLSFSYLFIEKYFAMITFAISVIRMVVFLIYEKKDIAVPIWLKSLFAALVLAAYVVVNVIVLKDTSGLDVMCLVANVFYTFCFGIRNLTLMRYVILVPNVLSVLYNFLLPATPFVILSYSFELGSNVLSIIKYHIFDKPQEETEVAKLSE